MSEHVSYDLIALIRTLAQWAGSEKRHIKGQVLHELAPSFAAASAIIIAVGLTLLVY